MRFVQISDVHLGASLALSALGLPAAKRDQRRRELTQALQSACQLARDERADIVLLPGDLFDHEGISGDTLAETAATLRDCALPIVIAPGNHDFYSPSSYYNPDFALSRHGLRWPPNVYLLTGGRWVRLRIPEVPDVAFTGTAFTNHASDGERQLQQLPAPEPGVQNVLVFHGSRLGHTPPGKAAVLPFSDEELERCGYDYAALGHYHSHSIVRDTAGRIRGAYSGCPAGRGLDETGPKGVLIGELTEAGVELSLVQVDKRVIHDLSLDCSGIKYNAALLTQIEERLRQANCRDCDIVHLRLVGRRPRTLDARIPAGFLADRCFHIKINASALTPDYDIEDLRSGPGAETTEGRFVQAIDRRIAVASDEEEQQRLRHALSYGLDALIAKQVVPRYESNERPWSGSTEAP